jgi:hypothetical protein
VAVGAVICQPDRDPCPLAEKRTLRPPFALSVGFGPAPSPPSGASPVAPSHDNQPQSIPTTSSYSSRPLPPELVEHPRPAPTPERGDAPRRKSRSRSRSTRSTASPYAQRARSRPARHGRRRAADDSPTDAPAAPATTAPHAPTTSPASANHHRSRHDPSLSHPRRFQQRGRTSPSPTGSLPSGISP